MTSLLLLVPLVMSQVNQEIYSETDLLAIDSEVQEVREPGPASFAVLPPPGFQEASPSSSAPAAGIPRQMVCSGGSSDEPEMNSLHFYRPG